MTAPPATTSQLSGSPVLTIMPRPSAVSSCGQPPAAVRPAAVRTDMSPAREARAIPAVAGSGGARPRAVVFCATAGDVAEALAVARRSGLQAVPRSGGHCFAGRSSSAGIVIDVTPMRSVSVADGVATIGAGARLGEVYDALARQGLTIPAGCGPGVGIAGLTLGGGLGILGRTHGLTSDPLLPARVGLAAGRPPEVNVFGAMLGDEAATMRLLGELAVHDPATAYTKPMPYRDTKRYLAGLGDQMSAGVPEAGHSFVKSEFFRRPVPDGAIAAV